MKHIFTAVLAIAVLILMSTNVYGQLNGVSVEDYAGYKTVWRVSDGCIRYMDNAYVLLGSTNNRYESTMATIFLGNSKESAILTLNDLQKIVNKETEIPKGGLVVKGYGDDRTTIYKIMGTFPFKTDGVAGETSVLWTMRHRFDEAKDAIRNFNGKSCDTITPEPKQDNIITESPVSSESKPSQDTTVQESQQDDKVTELMNRIASLESKIVELESKPENLSPQDRRKALQAEYDQCQKDIDAKKQEIKRLSDEVKELNARKNKLDNMLRSPNV